MPLFTSAAPRDPLAVTMTGVKLGDRLLVIGCREARLVAQLAIKPGLSGRACAVDEDAALSARAAAAAQSEGALLESETAPPTMLPYDEAAFDLVVLNHVLSQARAERRAGMLAEVRRVLRPGGRCVAIERSRRGGLAGLLRGAAADTGELEAALNTAGFRATRTLAEREGLAFVEGAKKG